MNTSIINQNQSSSCCIRNIVNTEQRKSYSTTKSSNPPSTEESNKNYKNKIKDEDKSKRNSFSFGCQSFKDDCECSIYSEIPYDKTTIEKNNQNLSTFFQNIRNIREYESFIKNYAYNYIRYIRNNDMLKNPNNKNNKNNEIVFNYINIINQIYRFNNLENNTNSVNNVNNTNVKSAFNINANVDKDNNINNDNNSIVSKVSSKSNRKKAFSIKVV